MEPILRTTIKDLVTEQIRHAIYTGVFQPREELRQIQLSERLGVSRSPIREALLILENAGLVEINKNNRAIVKEITAESVTEQLEIRILLECQAAVKACQKAESFSPLMEIQQQIELCLARADPEEFRLLNNSFHFKLWDLAESPRLARILGQLWFSIPSVYPVDPEANIHRNISEHRAILDALAIRDENGVKQAVAYHIHKTESTVLDLLPPVIKETK